MAKTSSIAFSQNFFHNGALDFWQRVVGNTTTINTATTSAAYLADRIQYTSSGATVKNYSIARSTDVPTFLQSGFQSLYSQLYTVVTPIASFAATDRVSMFQHFVEGFDYANLHGKTVTLQFWFKSSLAGTYSVSFRNLANNRCRVTTFTVSSANTWEFKSIPVPMDNTGTWNFDFNAGLVINIADYAGTNSTTSTLDTWQAGAFVNANTASNYYAAANTIRIAQVGLFLGNGAQAFSRSGKTPSGELTILQRFYEKSYALEQVPGTVTNNNTEAIVPCRTGGQEWVKTNFKVRKRTSPSLAIFSPVTGAVGQVRNDSSVADQAASVGVQGETGFNINTNAGDQSPIRWHYVADADF